MKSKFFLKNLQNFEVLGVTMTWNAEDQSVFAVKDDINVWLQQGNILERFNNEQITLPVAPKIINGTMLVPLSIITEIFGGQVGNIEKLTPRDEIYSVYYTVNGKSKHSNVKFNLFYKSTWK